MQFDRMRRNPLRSSVSGFMAGVDTIAVPPDVLHRALMLHRYMYVHVATQCAALRHARLLPRAGFVKVYFYEHAQMPY